MFSFFKKRKIEVDYSFLKTDMHSHLIPGIDDGAKTVEESISLIKALQDAGFQKIITTPHILKDHYPNTPETIRKGEEMLRTALAEQEMQIELEVAAEYFVDEYFESLVEEDKELLTFSGKHILIEFSTFAKPFNAKQIIFSLTAKGYQPILAHPERYLYYANDLNIFQSFSDMGCGLQLNLLSLSGYYGKSQKDLAIKMLKADLIDYLGTDLHRTRQLENIITFSDKSTLKMLQQKSFRNVLL